ncbi:hypothetical protein ABPG77_009755 [Micractinium sp. CCAP 211/92]
MNGSTRWPQAPQLISRRSLCTPRPVRVIPPLRRRLAARLAVSAVAAPQEHDRSVEKHSAGSLGTSGSSHGLRGKPRAKLPAPLASEDEDAPEGAFLSTSDDAAGEPLDRDHFKEGSRRHFRTVFDHDRWAAHRSTRRYVRHALGMFKSRMVRGLAAPLLYICGLSIVICAGHQAAEAGLLPAAAFEWTGSEPFALTSFALSLLLVFRTNASYSRWLDARKNWGAVVNRSRDLVRQGVTYIPRGDRALLDLLARWTVAFSRSLMAHLRSDVDAEAELRRVLRPAEAESALAAEHRPAYCLQVLSEIIKEAQQGAEQAQQAQQPLPNAAAVAAGPPGAGGLSLPASGPRMGSGAACRMDENLSILEDMVGGCERILRTPIPLSYTRHTSRFMIIYLSLLPFALFDSCRWATVPITCLISFLLLGIEEIGVAIEEPFSILPLEALCDAIERNVWELHRMHVAGADGAAGSGARRAHLSAGGVVQAARLGED